MKSTLSFYHNLAIRLALKGDTVVVLFLCSDLNFMIVKLVKLWLVVMKGKGRHSHQTSHSEDAGIAEEQNVAKKLAPSQGQSHALS